MNIKYLILIGLILTVISLGAVSASDDAAGDNLTTSILNLMKNPISQKYKMKMFQQHPMKTNLQKKQMKKLFQSLQKKLNWMPIYKKNILDTLKVQEKLKLMFQKIQLLILKFMLIMNIKLTFIPNTIIFIQIHQTSVSTISHFIMKVTTHTKS